MKKVSVIIPAFNAEKYIADAVMSVKRQSYGNVEIIVVDDGSRDESARVAESLGGVTCIRKPNGGVSSARNLGVQHASGEFIAFLDADDVWHSDKLRAQIALMELYEDCDLSYTRCSEDERDYQSHIAGRAIPFERGAPKHTVERSLAPSFRSPYFGTSTVVVRRSAFDAAKGFDQALPFAEDVDFYLKVLVRHSTVAIVEFPAVFKRPVAGSLGDDSVAGYDLLLKVYAMLLERHPELGQQHPGMVRDALADLHLRRAASLLARNERRLAFSAALTSMRMKPSPRCGALVLFAALPRVVSSGLLGAKRALRRAIAPDRAV